MAYDPQLADRVRRLVVGRKGVTEKAMFGGLAFLRAGKMFCGILGNELLARVGPDAHDSAMAKPHVRIMDFTGRPMQGYVFVGPAALGTDVALAGWVDQCEAHAASLPDKAKAGGKRPSRSSGKARRKPPRKVRSARRRA